MSKILSLSSSIPFIHYTVIWRNCCLRGLHSSNHVCNGYTLNLSLLCLNIVTAQCLLPLLFPFITHLFSSCFLLLSGTDFYIIIVISELTDQIHPVAVSLYQLLQMLTYEHKCDTYGTEEQYFFCKLKEYLSTTHTTICSNSAYPLPVVMKVATVPMFSLPIGSTATTLEEAIGAWIENQSQRQCTVTGGGQIPQGKCNVVV